VSITDQPAGSEPEAEATDPAAERKQARYWLNQIKAAEEREKKWRGRAEKIRKHYLDEDASQRQLEDDRRINILWSNTQVLNAAMFSRLGDPDVRRAFPKPGKDNAAARTAAIVLERVLTACANRYNTDGQFEAGIEDRNLPGRGQVWLEFEPGEPDENGEVTYQEAKIQHVCWDQWVHGPGRRWEEVPWVARRHLMDKDSVKSAFGEEVAREAEYSELLAEGQTFDDKHDQADFYRAVAWEIWDKKSRERIYVMQGVHRILKRDDDPYRLEGFFPCPEPLLGSHQTDSLIPTPDYALYQDQADELNRINTRIYQLVEKMRYCGVYPAEAEETLQNLGYLNDGEFIPIKDFTKLMQSGGLRQYFQTRDLAPIGQAIDQLTQRALQIMQSIYEVMGIADIMRGSSDPSETLGAQQLKAQFGSQRLRKRQMEVERWIKESIRMKAEIIAEYFERDQLQEMSGILLPPREQVEGAKQQLQRINQARQQAQQMQAQAAQGGAQGQMGQVAQFTPQNGQMPAQGGMQAFQQQQQMQVLQQLAATPQEQIEQLQEVADAVPWEDIERILRSDDRRNNKIDVETDITAFEQTEEEKKQRVAFVQNMLQMLGEIVPAMQGNTAMAAYGKELALFGHRAFKVGRGLEESLEEAFEQMAKAPQQQQADPQVERDKAKLKLEQARFQLDQARAKQDMQMKQSEFAAKQQERQMDMAAKAQDQQLDRQSRVADLAMQRNQQQLDMSAKQLDLVARSYEHGLKREEMTLENLSSLLDYELKRRQLEMQDDEGARVAA